MMWKLIFRKCVKSENAFVLAHQREVSLKKQFREIFLGFDYRAEQKIGRPFDWIRTARDQRELSQQDFYKHCEIVLQPTDTTENWPRVGFEAMASGSVLIVDNRGGWQQMIKHGETGFGILVAEPIDEHGHSDLAKMPQSPVRGPAAIGIGIVHDIDELCGYRLRAELRQVA